MATEGDKKVIDGLYAAFDALSSPADDASSLATVAASHSHPNPRVRALVAQILLRFYPKVTAELAALVLAAVGALINDSDPNVSQPPNSTISQIHCFRYFLWHFPLFCLRLFLKKQRKLFVVVAILLLPFSLLFVLF
jgi:hypothetical protein